MVFFLVWLAGLKACVKNVVCVLFCEGKFGFYELRFEDNKTSLSVIHQCKQILEAT